MSDIASPAKPGSPEPLWTVVCARLLVDRRTGRRTILDVVESVSLTEPRTCELVTLWRNVPTEEANRWSVRLIVELPSGSENNVGNAPLETTQGTFAYSVVPLDVDVFTEPGVHRLRIQIRRGKRTRWHDVGSLPFDVTGEAEEARPDVPQPESPPSFDPKARYTVFTDGAARGNPGPAGIGAVFFDENGDEVHSLSEAIGEATNNVAEYRALIAALKAAKQFGIRRLDIRSDSELMVKQMRGIYRVASPTLAPLHAQAAALLASLDEGTIRHVPRSENQIADRLASDAAST